MLLHHLDINRVVQSDAGTVEDSYGSVRQSEPPLDSALHDDDSGSVKDFSDDRYSYAGAIVRGVLRGDSECGWFFRDGR